MNLKICICVILGLLLAACSHENMPISPQNEPPKLIDEHYDVVKDFSPDAYFPASANQNAVAKEYFNQSNLERIKFHLAKWLKTPYKLGGTSHVTGADCSAFSQQLMHQAFNITLSRSTTYQRREGKRINPKDLKAGDLLFFRTSGPNGLHVGIYLEKGSFIHLSEHGGARVQRLNMAYWSKRFLEARRYIKDKQ